MKEIERKFLLAIPAEKVERQAAHDRTLVSRRLIQQRYMPTQGWKLRIKAIREDGLKPVHLFVFKNASTGARIEVQVSEKAHLDMKSFCEAPLVVVEGTRSCERAKLGSLKDWTVRIRRSTMISGGDPKFEITLKRKITMASCDEIESTIDQASHDAISALCPPALRKRRICVLYASRVWEVDTFLNPELLGTEVAEIELPSETTPISIPCWIGAEVTQDREYKCAKMSKRIAA